MSAPGDSIHVARYFARAMSDDRVERAIRALHELADPERGHEWCVACSAWVDGQPTSTGEACPACGADTDNGADRVQEIARAALEALGAAR